MGLSVLSPPAAVNARHPLHHRRRERFVHTVYARCYTVDMGLFRPTRIPPEETAEIVERKLKWILAACEPREVWLFGSAARGELTEASDVDLAVICADDDALRAARRGVYEQERPDMWPQDVIFFEQRDFYERAGIGGLPMLIVQEGRRIYPGRAA